MFAGLDESIALDLFMMEKASRYFQEAAEKSEATDQKKEYLNLSTVFAQATVIGLKLEHEERDLTQEEEAVFQKMAEWGRTSSQEQKAAIEKYALNKIDDFISEDPGRWERIKKHLPETAEKIQKVTGRRL